MKRRKILKWTAPVVTAVVLPAHAVTTDAETETCCTVSNTPAPTLPPTKPPVTTSPPKPTPPPPKPTPPPEQWCDDDKVLICHNPHKEAITKCVPSEALKGHLGHGDFIGGCDE